MRGLKEIALEILKEYEGDAPYVCEWAFDSGACEESIKKRVEEWREEIESTTKI